MSTARQILNETLTCMLQGTDEQIAKANSPQGYDRFEGDEVARMNYLDRLQNDRAAIQRVLIIYENEW